MSDLISFLNFVADFLEMVSDIIADNWLLHLSVGLPLFAVCLYTILMFKRR